jgi:hypothetical protein
MELILYGKISVKIENLKLKELCKYGRRIIVLRNLKLNH